MPLAVTFRNVVVDWGRDAVDFIYPPACARCRMALPSAVESSAERTSGTRRFCDECFEILRCRIQHACLTCGAPVGPHLETWGCRYCRRDHFAFERVVTLGVYEQELKSCCVQMKEPYQESLAAGLSELLWEAHEATLSGAGIDLVVPVPHHWWDRMTRQALPPVTIARVLARRLSVPAATHILAKRRRTPAQSSLSPSRRRTNLKGAFGLVGGATLKGRTILLTDDVLTTGTTADRAARVLKDAGAACVLVGVVARGLGQSTHV